MIKTSIIMASHPNNLEELQRSVEHIRKFTSRDIYELIIVDTIGSQEIKVWLGEQADIKSIFTENELKLSQAWNRGVQIAIGEAVLLMTADHLVTEGWLPPLVDSLYQEEQIGMIAPLTNHSWDEHSQRMFSSVEEMLSFSNSLKFLPFLEERLILAHTPIIIKQEVLSQIGGFDEQYNGETTVADFCLQLKHANWKLALCKHIFVYSNASHHTEPKMKDHLLFVDKWGFSLLETMIQERLINCINASSSDDFKLLIVGSGIGATNIKLNERFARAEIFGYNHSGNFPQFDGVKQLSHSNLKNYEFDYILIGSETLPDQKLLSELLELLDLSGQLIVELKNINNYGVVKNILLGYGVNPTSRYWKMTDIPYMFEHAGYGELDFDYVIPSLNDEDRAIIEDIRGMVDHLPAEFEVESFVVTARKTPKADYLHQLFSNLLSHPDEKTMLKLVRNSTQQILSSLDNFEGPVTAVLNIIAVYNFEQGATNDVLPYLNRAYELEPTNQETIINLAKVMDSLGNDEDALMWLNKMQDKNEEINDWIIQLQQKVYARKFAATQLKFLLRRIENDVDQDKAIQKVIELLKDREITTEDILSSTSTDIIQKTDLLNLVAVSCFNVKEYDFVIPLLEYSYTVDPVNQDTLYNIGYVLYKFGAYQDALNFLSQINTPDQEVIGLCRDIEGVISNATQ